MGYTLKRVLQTYFMLRFFFYSPIKCCFIFVVCQSFYFVFGHEMHAIRGIFFNCLARPRNIRVNDLDYRNHSNYEIDNLGYIIFPFSLSTPSHSNFFTLVRNKNVFLRISVFRSQNQNNGPYKIPGLKQIAVVIVYVCCFCLRLGNIRPIEPLPIFFLSSTRCMLYANI